MADEKLLWVRSKRPDDQVVFYEVDARHPGGSAMVAGKSPVQVADTALVAEALRQGAGKGIGECSEADRAAWLNERGEARSVALAEGTPAGFVPASALDALRAELAELRARVEKPAAKPRE